MSQLTVSSTSTIVGIETSCDETAVAVLRGGEVISSVIKTQGDVHVDFGGVVPELASREHVRVITAAVDEALVQAFDAADPSGLVDAVAVTRGPGLAGALMVGVAAAKALCIGYNLPLVGIDHMEGHLFAATIERPLPLPSLVLLVSGGHTQLVSLEAPGDYRYLGGTIDDAAGEAFDKVGRMLGLTFPGGPAIEALAVDFEDNKVRFPRAMSDKGLEMSFSGIKTAVANVIKGPNPPLAGEIAAAFQEAVVDVLALKLKRAAKAGEYRSISLGGGVASNSKLRERVCQLGEQMGIEIVIPSKKYCTDNGAMIAAAGAFRYERGEESLLSLKVSPSLEMTAS